MADKNAKPIAKVQDIQEGKALAVEVDGEKILLTRHKGKICACGNSCPHYGADLSDGWIEDGHVVCPWHYAQFDLESGRRQEPPSLDDLPTWETRIEGENIFLGAKIGPEISMPAGKDSRRFLIVGGGAAGEAAAETLRREGFAGEIVLFSSDSQAPYDRPALSKELLSGAGKKEWLPLRSKEFYETLAIELRLESRVMHLDPKAIILEMEDGSRESGNMVLLASGSRPRTIPLPGFEGENCHLLRSLDEAEKLVAALEGVKHVALIGAGFIALEAASSLRARGIEVDIVAPESVPMERVFGREVGERIQAIHSAEGVRFHLQHRPKEVLRNGGIEGLLLENGEKIKTDLILMAVGVEPAIDYLEGSGLTENGAVRVNERFETAEPGVFAAGDIALFPAPGGKTRIEHWITAQKEAIHAAKAMLGSREAFNEVPVFWTKQYTYSFKYVGYLGNFDHTVLHGDLQKDSWITGYYRNGALIGAATLGRGGDLLKVREQLRRGTNISPDEFANGKFGY